MKKPQQFPQRFVLLLLLTWAHRVQCIYSSEISSTTCRVSGAKLLAANVFRVWWKAHPSKEYETDDLFACQLRLTRNNSCEDPLEELTKDIKSWAEVHNHTFWRENTIDVHRLCIRTVTHKGDGGTVNSDWSTNILPVNLRTPLVIKKCLVSIGNTEASVLRFEKHQVYLFSKGDNITFTCYVEGRTNLRIRWCRNALDCSGLNELNSKVLQLYNADKHHEGVYVAVVENDFGRLVSSGMHIKMTELGEFEGDSGPTSLTFNEGDSFHLSCRAPNSVPEPAIGWIKKGKDPMSFHQGRVLGLDGSLIILNANVSDSGTYACKVTNRVLDESLESRETIVTVDEAVFNWPIQPVIQNKNPTAEETVLALVGKEVRLQCVFSGRPIPQLSWYKDSMLLSLSDNRIVNSLDSYTLTIKPVLKTDEGSYRCQGNNAVGSNHFTIKLIVHEPPKIIDGLKSRNATVGDDVLFTCKSDGIPQPVTEWMINGTLLTADLLHLLNGNMSSDKSQITFPKVNFNQSCNIQCNVTNDYSYAVSQAYLSVFSATKIVNEPFAVVNYDEEFMILNCEAETDVQTPLYINWLYHEGVSISENSAHKLFKNGTLLVNLTTSVDVFVNYTCLAGNGLSSDERLIHVWLRNKVKQKNLVDSHPSFGVVMMLVVLSAALVILLVTVLLAFVCIRKSKHQIHHSRHALSSFSDPGIVGPQRSYISYGDSRSFGSDDCLVCENGWSTGLIPLNNRLKAAIREMYIPKDRLQLEKIIGKGQFGRVYSAFLHDPRGDLTEQVAVKTMKYKPDESEMVELFLREAVIMKDFQHLNVLGIRGITFDADSSPMVILPYMANGDLRKYILQPELNITILQLLMMGLQVAHGMFYLSNMRFVHRDLAARNCMVNERGVVKVADFGLSRELVLRDYYRVESSGTNPVPVRWMAPECLEANVFTTMSDVWSFGVLLWELMTRGAVPYPDVENWEIVSHVQSGKRLSQPSFCPDIVYKIMTSCWEVEQHQRPSFRELVDGIQNVIQSAKPGTCISSFLYHNIAQTAASESETGSTRIGGTLDYRE